MGTGLDVHADQAAFLHGNFVDDVKESVGVGELPGFGHDAVGDFPGGDQGDHAGDQVLAEDAVAATRVAGREVEVGPVAGRNLNDPEGDRATAKDGPGRARVRVDVEDRLRKGRGVGLGLERGVLGGEEKSAEGVGIEIGNGVEPDRGIEWDDGSFEGGAVDPMQNEVGIAELGKGVEVAVPGGGEAVADAADTEAGQGGEQGEGGGVGSIEKSCVAATSSCRPSGAMPSRRPSGVMATAPMIVEPAGLSMRSPAGVSKVTPPKPCRASREPRGVTTRSRVEIEPKAAMGISRCSPVTVSMARTPSRRLTEPPRTMKSSGPAPLATRLRPRAKLLGMGVAASREWRPVDRSYRHTLRTIPLLLAPVDST